MQIWAFEGHQLKLARQLNPVLSCWVGNVKKSRKNVVYYSYDCKGETDPTASASHCNSCASYHLLCYDMYMNIVQLIG